MRPESAASARLRLDELLVRRGLFASRSRARDAVERGVVSVAGRLAVKAGMSVDIDADLGVDDPASVYVSRAALKLVAGLDRFGFDLAGRIALDLGASTGGFTQVLLERGASKVYALDVGHGQMAPPIAADPRVILREKLNARDLSKADLCGEAPAVVVCDVSFISLRLALPPALSLAAPRAFGVFLVKPQFEVGRGAIGKGGIVRNTADAERAAHDVRAWLDALGGWRTIGMVPSPVLGGDGNAEYLLGALKDER